MGVEIRVGPPVITINRGSTFMVTDQNGEIDQTKPQGLFAEDTRFISTYQMYINDQPWMRVTSSAVTYYAALLHLLNPRVLTPDGKGWIEEETIALTLQRTINTGLHELFLLSNYSENTVRFMLELAMRSDFADLFEVKANRLTRRGHIETTWDSDARELTTCYKHEDFERRVVYRINDSTSPPGYANGRLLYEIELPAHGEWRADAGVLLLHRGRRMTPAGRRRHGQTEPERRKVERGEDLQKLQHEWMRSCTELRSPNNTVTSAYLQAIEDMGSLRLPEHDLGPDVWIPAAGVPWFVALFGRDSLIASYQTMMVHAPFARGALRELARYQATERDDWRDAQPGKILHELRHGELAHFHQVPFTPYYGTADATILYLIILHEYYKWTGDLELVKELRDVADHCLQWIDNSGDADGDGFQEWKTFSDQGYENMGWKDAGDAIVYGNGSQSTQPKGTCELQGYVYDAKVRMAELFDVLGDRDKAERLRQEAAALQARFEQVFWMEHDGIYALGLDHEKKLIDAVASNAGQCLWSGIVSPERARRVAKRLFEDDMWCGWGIRTLSSRNPAYNPYSYQRGSVWPHDNGIIAAGLKHYGLADEANKIAEAIFNAASFFDTYRLPEVYCGVARRPANFPSQYLGANIPQAWAAGSVPHLIRMMLGLRPDAPNGVLYVNPTLPDWLPEVTLQRLKIGRTALDLRFWRDEQGPHFEVLRQQGKELQVIQDTAAVPTPRTVHDESPQSGQARRASKAEEQHRPASKREQPAAKGSKPEQRPVEAKHDGDDGQPQQGDKPEQRPAEAKHDGDDGQSQQRTLQKGNEPQQVAPRQGEHDPQ